MSKHTPERIKASYYKPPGRVDGVQVAVSWPETDFVRADIVSATVDRLSDLRNEFEHFLESHVWMKRHSTAAYTYECIMCGRSWREFEGMNHADDCPVKRAYGAVDAAKAEAA